MSADATTSIPNRRKPEQGVRLEGVQPTIVFLTACTKTRKPWLACPEAHERLRETWVEADAWRVGEYVLMPDHLHLFVSPKNLRFQLERWTIFWKSQFSRRHAHPDWAWQASVFHHRLRSRESYVQKWDYVQNNPVRAGLVAEASNWPFMGRIHELIW